MLVTQKMRVYPTFVGSPPLSASARLPVHSLQNLAVRRVAGHRRAPRRRDTPRNRRDGPWRPPRLAPMERNEHDHNQQRIHEELAHSYLPALEMLPQGGS